MQANDSIGSVCTPESELAEDMFCSCRACEELEKAAKESRKIKKLIKEIKDGKSN